MIAGVITDLTNWLDKVSSHWWFLVIIVVIATAALGAFLGDNTAFLLGVRASDRFHRRAARRPRFATKMDWAHQQINDRGGLLLITARFIPGGRTALTLSCGITRQRQAWFIRWVIVATVIWASYAALLGRIGGEAFKDNHTKAFMFAFGLAIGTNVIIEVTRHHLKKRRAAAATG